ncbi:MAG: carboxyl transferase domain-containing protein, partial [Candidatus Cybelea sp.]
MKSRAEKYEELEAKRAESAVPAGPEALARQHARGKRSARERIEALVDEDSFVEFDRFVIHRANAFGLDEKEFLGDGVITGRATIDG